MDMLGNAIRGLTSSVNSTIGTNRWGVVTSTRGTDTGYQVKVKIQPDGVLTSWLPVLSHSVGGGWGIVAPPEPGMQAFLIPDTGDGEHSVVIGLSYSQQTRPPVPPNNFRGSGAAVKPGEIALVSKAGTVVRLCADGTVYIKGAVRIEGNLTVEGDIRAQANAGGGAGEVYDKVGPVSRLRTRYNSHIHGNSAGTSAPDVG